MSELIQKPSIIECSGKTRRFSILWVEILVTVVLSVCAIITLLFGKYEIFSSCLIALVAALNQVNNHMFKAPNTPEKTGGENGS